MQNEFTVSKSIYCCSASRRGSIILQVTVSSSWILLLVTVVTVNKAHAVSGGGEDHEHEAGHDCHPQRQVLEQLLGVIVGIWEETLLQPDVAAGDGEEDDR